MRLHRVMDEVRGTPVRWFVAGVADLACLAQAVTDHEIHMATHAGPARHQCRRGLRTPRRRTPIKVEARLVRSCSAMMIFACAYAVAGAPGVGPKACPVDHGTGSRSQMLIEA